MTVAVSRASGLSWMLAGGLAAWAVARVAAVDRLPRAGIPAVPLLTLTPHVAAVAPWAALGLRAAGQRRPATATAAAAAALSLVVQPRRFPRPQPGACGPVLRVMTANLFCGRAAAAAVTAQVRRAGVDALFLQELTPDAVSRLKHAGLDDLMPHARHDLRGGTRGSGIYSRYPLSEGPAVAPAYMAQPSAVAELPRGNRVELVCVHPVAPGLPQWGGAAQWREELAALPAPGELPRVLAGDFNASLDHAAFRGLLRRGYADAAQQTGNALAPTWGPGRGAAVTLDHILADRSCAVLSFSVHALPGSDHRAVHAEIQLPERQHSQRPERARLTG